MTVRGEPGIDPCGQDAVILAVGAAMAQATFSLVFDQIHLVSRPTGKRGQKKKERRIRTGVPIRRSFFVRALSPRGRGIPIKGTGAPPLRS